ncbi:hypothetical protein [Pedobacter sp. Leaf194]|uniref:hypothetical protein n=1 Tax=Pedobacter sp. Leaf194 TaxID=1736297 RepID=UPI0007037595|nr:hypothetical protein [Pedobacter sp. Leaf194]KQS41906.1 hypothetical protein ASG14_05550 [Pedobacter sp. Leaf194]
MQIIKSIESRIERASMRPQIVSGCGEPKSASQTMTLIWVGTRNMPKAFKAQRRAILGGGLQNANPIDKKERLLN